ncbi:MAG: hypothetical protein HY22_09225 [[Candidatus Thermochlorobacteriaceae] bacterium GBChlB]|nr:MAG: hypothetical protein HY22_09225 [[Candidatus Thermochlorobacteriaceae] bacterium GBChlB]
MTEWSAMMKQPLRVVDVGARYGVHPRWKKLMRELPLDVIAFEPDETECKRLNTISEENVRYLPFALGEKDESAMLHLLVGEASSSIYKPNYDLMNRTHKAGYFEIAKSIPLQTRSLDAVMAEEKIDDIDYLKIDTEGYEIKILNGATTVLKNVFAVELEVWFNRMFEGAPLFRDVDAYMEEKGFVLFDVARSNWSLKRKTGKELGGPRGQLVCGDAIYFRDLATTPEINIFFQRDKFIRCIILLLQYHYYDCALEALEKAISIQALEKNEIQTIESVIRKSGQRWRPEFMGIRHVRRFIRYLDRFFTRFDEGEQLGNW